MSKVVERLVCVQVTAFLDSHKLLPDSQCAHRKHHSTETAVRKIVSDMADSGKVTLLGLLDMSAASFDTVDHDVLLDRLSLASAVKSCPGLNRSSQVELRQSTSEKTNLPPRLLSVMSHKAAYSARCYFYYTLPTCSRLYSTMDCRANRTPMTPASTCPQTPVSALSR